MSKIEQQLMFLVGLLVGMLGLYVMIGWLLTNPAMVKIIPGSAVMVFNTALCFLLAGLWLILKPTATPDGVVMYGVATLLAVCIISLSGIVFAENISGIDFGIDWKIRHDLILDRNTTPGRMAPNTCVGFILIGVVFLFDHAKNLHLKKAVFIGLGGIIFFLGASSLLGYAMDLDWLYRFIQQNRMATTTAIGLSLIGIILIFAGQSKTYDLPADNQGEDIRLTRIAAVIMILLSLASGLTGFVTLKQGTDQVLRTDLQEKTANNADIFETALQRRYVLADKLLSFPVLAKDIATLPVTPNDTNSLEHIRKVGVILMDMGFSGLQIEDNTGHSVFLLGQMVDHSDLSLPVKVADRDATLLWDNGLVIHIEKPILKDDAVIGQIITEQPLKTLDKIMHELQFSGKTTDAAVCQRADDSFVCFPTRFIPHVVHAPMFANGAPAFPMAHALLGETGIIYANDIRGIPVLAAYTPIGSTGLGFVVKIETTELYSFIREKLDMLLAILACFVIAGTYILRVRMQPLASRLVRSEQRMRTANELLEQDANRLSQIIDVQNKVARSPMDIAATLQIIVAQVQNLTYSDGTVVELIDGEELFYQATSGVFATFGGFRLRIAGSLSGYCINARTIVRCDDTETDPRTDKVATRKLNIRSMIVTPLIHEGKIVGVLKTASTRINAFGPEDEQALQLLSGLMGSAIGHQQDFEEKQRLLGERTKALSELEKTTDFLRASEERTRVIIDSAYDAFIAMDNHGQITDWNKQAEILFGWSRDEVMGRSLNDLIMPTTSQPAYIEQLEQVLSPDYAQGQSKRLELNVVRRTGGVFAVEMTLNPIRTPNTVMLTAFLHDITERMRVQQKLTQLAQFDALTSLPNRSLFMDRLSMTALRAARSGRALALMFLDLDGFKKINDTYGHHAGDILLKQFAERLTMTVRTTDTVSRLAGDEFTIILEELADPEHDVELVAGKIIQAMTRPFNIAGEQVTITTSIGIVISKTAGKNTDELIQSADAEMYKAKNQGKNQFSLRWL